MKATIESEAVEVAIELGRRFRNEAASRDLNREYPDELVNDLKASGLMALFVPVEYGGLDAAYPVAVQVFAALAEGDPNLAHITQAHHCGVEYLKSIDARAIMDKYFPSIVSKGSLVVSAFSEVGTKNVNDMQVTIRPDRDGALHLSGRKFYATGSRWADAFFVPARLEGAAGTPNTEFLNTDVLLSWVRANADGLSVVDDWDGMGQRLTSSGSVVFQDVPLEVDSYVKPEEFNVPENLGGAHAQIIFCAIHVGIARAAFSECLDYVREKARPWIHSGVERAADDPYVLHRIGSMDVDLQAAEALLVVAAQILEQARSTGTVEDRDRAVVAVSRSKANSTQAALRICHEMFQVCGTSSTRRTANLGRHWRNIRTLSLHDPVDYKYRLIGDYLVNGASPPVSAWT